MTEHNLANLFASKFIARPDVKAKQSKDGAWYVHNAWNPETRKYDGPRIPWGRAHLDSHLAGTDTFGHYLLSTESKCKLFAFDIDLEKSGTLPARAIDTSHVVDEASAQEAYAAWDASFYEEADLRGAWLNRAHPGRGFLKFQFKLMAHSLCRTIIEELGIPCAVAYSGGKGVHVYGFTGLIPASEAREGAQIVLDTLKYSPVRGDNFFKHPSEDVLHGFPNLSIEVFPKQGNLDGKDLGNLMRLPLGKNLKAPKEPTFFIDMTSPLADFRPVDPIAALTAADPFA